MQRSVVESNADKGVSANPFYAKLSDSEGYTFDVTLGGKEPSLKAENDIKKGRKMRGWVTFEVPAEAKGLTVSYEQLVFLMTRANLSGRWMG